MFFFSINKKRFIISIIIAGVALAGDRNGAGRQNDVAAAVCDNVSHALIGALTWIGMYAYKTSKADFYFLLEIFLCTVFSSLIDADHFIAAKSLSLKDATKLKTRPFMHCTTLTTLLVLSIMLASHFLKINWLCKLGWILAAAFFSHHIRDSNRRGFWLWPFGSTPPTPTVVYIAALMLLPHFLSYLVSQFGSPQSSKGETMPTIETV